MSQDGLHRKVRETDLIKEVLEVIVERRELTECPICSFGLGQSACFRDSPNRFGFETKKKTCFNCNVLWELNLVGQQICLRGHNRCDCQRSVFAPPDEHGIALYPEGVHIPATEPCRAGQGREPQAEHASF